MAKLNEALRVNNSTLKHITPIGVMSNLVGCYLFVIEDEKIKRTGFVYGKAEDHYLIQWHNAMTGSPMQCQLFTVLQMVDWMFCPTREIADEIAEDYSKHGRVRYSMYKKDNK